MCRTNIAHLTRSGIVLTAPSCCALGVPSAGPTRWCGGVRREASLMRQDRAVTHILDDLQWRGLLAQTTDADALRAALDAGPLTFYCGFDPTGPSLHVGHLTQVLTMRRLQLAGHRPLALAGGATGLIGDPKPGSERSMLSLADAADNVRRIEAQLARFLAFDDSPSGAVAVNNLDWTAPMDVISFLRDIGKHFSVNRMLDREAVKARLEGSGISYTEFSYVLLQSMDYLELRRRHDCRLQIGGSDQWGNITAGCELVRRVDGEHVHALTTHLLTKADGTKFGKTESGSVWLDPSMTSPYAFFQFWLNTDDRDVSRYLRVFSFRSHEEIAQLEASAQAKPAAREAQRALARELTALVHGAEAAQQAEDAARALFGQAELSAIDEATLEAALAEAGLVDEPGEGACTIVDLLTATGLVDSKSAARRAVTEGGAYLNNVRVEDPETVPAQGDWLHGRLLVVRRGKRSIAGVVRPGRQ
jgi:tyrosyl-tRNA synthetase